MPDEGPPPDSPVLELTALGVLGATSAAVQLQLSDPDRPAQGGPQGRYVRARVHLSSSPLPSITVPVATDACFEARPETMAADPTRAIDTVLSDIDAAGQLELARTSTGVVEMELFAATYPAATQGSSLTHEGWDGYRTGWLVPGASYALRRSGTPVLERVFVTQPLQVLSNLQAALSKVQPIDLRWEPGNGDVMAIRLTAMPGDIRLICLARDDGAFAVDPQAVVDAGPSPGRVLRSLTRIRLERYNLAVRDGVVLLNSAVHDYP